MQNLLPLVIINGLIDSFNPCAIAILLLFIALSFTLLKNRSFMLVMGLFYILSIYVTYLLIGLGLLKVMHIFGIPHLISIIAASLVIVAGLIGLKDYFFPNFLPNLNLRISLGTRQIISEWIYKASIPAIIVVGFLVALGEFPCSGAIYLSTISLLEDNATFLKGFVYLLLYNLMFVLPLIVIYLVAINRKVVEKMIFWQESKASTWRLINALVTLALGIIILVFFVIK
ncbi:MAG: hypothetical protein M1338_01470 [Patescibacteria group bacterium]|nr:hypothetical protein [Patescibacteria group bacterium]